MIASVACTCGDSAANVPHRTASARPVAMFIARLVAVARGWAVDPTEAGEEPGSGVCPTCLVRWSDAAMEMSR